MADVVESLIADAYGSLTGPDQHAAFMRSLAKAFRSHVIAHQVDRPGHAHAALEHYDEQGRCMDELASASSRQPYTNPWFSSPMASRLLRDGIASEEGCLDAASLRRTEFYADVLKPFDIFHSFGFLLEKKAATSVVSISRSHREGYYQPREMQLAKRLLPHLRNIQAMQKLIGDNPLNAAEPYPTWLLAADGRICGRNRDASLLAATDSSVISELSGMLSPAHLQDRAALHAEIVDLLAGTRLSGRVPIRDKTGTPRYIAQLRHCRREAFLTWLITDPPAALVALHPIESDASTLEPALVRLYGLTAAECRVAAKLHELESIQSVAASLSRSEETIRSQVKSVFNKTGTHSQAQLLKLLYALIQG